MWKKFLLVIVVICAVLGNGGIQATAQTIPSVQTEKSGIRLFTVQSEQELYEVLSDQLMRRKKNFYIAYEGTMDEALEKITKQLNAKKTNTYWKGMYTLLQNMAEAVDDPLTTSDSDYLTGILDYASMYYLDGVFCFEEVHYYETAAQTKKVDKKIKRILKKRKLYDETDPMTIIKSVHDYMIHHITYDVRNINKCNYSVYDGLFEQRTVCNGYALLAYKMLNELGIPCKYISGPAETEEGVSQLHAWNIVKIGKKWYYLDVTWDDNDDGRVYYDYFLLGRKNFRKDHTPDAWYRTESYLQMYPISGKDYLRKQ